MNTTCARAAAVALLAVLMTATATDTALAEAAPPVETGSDESRLTARVVVVPGENWTTRMKVAFVSVKKGPQCAVWIETEDGEYVATLTATARTAENEWRAAPEEGRPESLPVWSAARARGNGGAAGTSGAADGVDAVSSATPMEGVEGSRSGIVLKPGAPYVVRCEVNHSFDYNDAWPKKAKPGDARYSGVNGQPSLVYEGRFVAGTDASVDLVPVGTGSVDGSSGGMTAGFEGMTSALSIIGSIRVILAAE